MTEDEWLASTDPGAMYAFVRDATTSWRTRWVGWVTGRRFSIGERKLRLACCACCALVAHLLPADEARACLAVSERFAEGLADAAELEEAIERSMIACHRRLCETTEEHPWLMETSFAANAIARVHRTDEQGRAGLFHQVALAGAYAQARQAAAAARQEWQAFATPSAIELAISAEDARQADLLRDVFGNPFRPARLDPAWLLWDGGAVPRIAQAIHAARGYQDLPVLGDALEEAGCADEAVLRHCRGGGPHVPGCWVVDLVLGKA